MNLFMRPLNLTGKSYGHLTVIGPTDKKHPTKYRHDKARWWSVKCRCGTETEYPGKRLKRGEIISCGCMAGTTKELGESAKWASYCWTRINAKRRKIPFLLTLEQYLSLTGSPCSYCGIAWSTQFPNYKRKDGQDKFHGAYKRNGIDRVDSSVGYIIVNCVPCCKTCNYAKAQMSLSQFRDWVYRVYHHFEPVHATT